MCACGNATPTSLASTHVFDVIKISSVKLLVDRKFGYLCGNIIYANYASSCEGA